MRHEGRLVDDINTTTGAVLSRDVAVDSQELLYDHRDGVVGTQPRLCYGEYVDVIVLNEVTCHGRFSNLLHVAYKSGFQQAERHLAYRWHSLFTGHLNLNEILCCDLASCDEQRWGGGGGEGEG